MSNFNFEYKGDYLKYKDAHGNELNLNGTLINEHIEEEINDLKSQIKKYGAYALNNDFYTKMSATSQGVAYTWQSDGTCVVSGTATGASVNNLYDDTSHLPPSITAGQKYAVKYTTTDINVRLSFACHKSDSTTAYYNFTTDGILTVPSNCVGMTIRLYVVSGVSFANPAIVSVMDILTLDNPYTMMPLELSAKGILPNNTDLNTVKALNGYYLLNSIYTYTNIPETLSYGATLVVYNATSTITTQYIINHNPSGSNWQRVYVLGTNTWSNWVKASGITNNYNFLEYNNTYSLTATPTITTDTNNYLAPSGDTTDRTADIMSMLTATGVCNLGPGRFYVSGIDIPVYGELSGCGNKTEVVLISGHDYAVKLNSYSTVRDLRIIGQTTNYAPESTVGTRHGILWQGSASETESGTSALYRGIIDNVTISDFNGGGITLYNTGLAWSSSVSVTNVYVLRCDAGINIPYFSEFNRFTNVLCSECYYGCVDNGGNNYFSNCNFSRNVIGVLMDNSQGQSRNNSHGTFSCCAFAHSGEPMNSGIALKILGIDNGELFTGCQFGYGSIVIDESSRVVFSGCAFLSGVNISIDDSISTLFGTCTIVGTNTITVTNSPSTHFSNCYDNSGNAVDPMEA